jgi:hypothetical protein
VGNFTGAALSSLLAKALYTWASGLDGEKSLKKENI